MNFLKNLASGLLDDQECFTDLTQIAVVDENACLDVLHKRHANDTIYTHCGPLLVATNPYKDIDGLYTDEELEKHLVLMPAEPCDPHVYGMAARAYQQMMATGTHQAVVISGESGAGKTETAKVLLQYLARAAAGHSGEEGDARTSLRERVMGTNPIMESYGCAQTVRNDNSSRFGKLVVLQFTKTGRLSAANVQTYLLEKSRVAHQAPNEANYHAFYEMLVGMSAQELSDIHSERASLTDFGMLNTEAARLRNATKDSSLYVRTRAAMSAIGIGDECQAGIMKLMLAILHLGNIEFGDGETAEVDENSSALAEAARLLGCDPAHLGAGMCSRRLKAGADWVTTGNTTVQANDVRHALAKQLYSFTFSWLVAQINTSLACDAVAASHGHGPHIAYVDIFGFEIFTSNSLEQLCINFANERLQRLFIGVLFESVHKTYEAEGIQVEKSSYSDNKRVTDLIGGAPQGLLAMLTEECVFPKGTDASYLQKICGAFQRHESFKEEKRSQTDFTVRHYAGEVTYSVTGFLEKNKDPISQDLLVLVQFSDDLFVSSLVKTAIQIAADAAAASTAADGPKKGSRLRSGKFVGVVDSFKVSLKSLISILQDGEMHFIRCLKPNDAKAADSWDRSVVLRQLQSAGLVHAVAATRSGFPDHLAPMHVVSSFGPLTHDVATVDERGNVRGDSETAAAVLREVGLSDDQYAIGKTKIFLRQGVLTELQRLRLEHISEHATLVQCAIRRLLAQRLLRRLREAALRKAEERRRREDELRRQREEAERLRREQEQRERDLREKQEAEELARRKAVQASRALSFDRRRRKKLEEEERKAREDREAAEAAIAARKAEAERKRAEADERMRAVLAAQGVHTQDSCGARQMTEAAVARAEAEAAAAHASSKFELNLPGSPELREAHSLTSASKPATGGGGFQLTLPSSPTVFESAVPAVGPLMEQRHMDEMASQFACPIEDVLAYAEMVGMDVREDADLLWIADEALQAPEPVGWEERQDPRGNTYYFNTTTNMTMLQHPVDYHYQQLYLQMKMGREQEQRRALMTPRTLERSIQEEATAATEISAMRKLDLRSVNADASDDMAAPTPKGWLSRAGSLLTPRSSARKEAEAVAAKQELGAMLEEYTCVEVEVVVRRGRERLGMELNAYNQILTFQPGGVTDNHPDMHLYDRVVVVDGVDLTNRMLTDVLQQRESHTFVLERWAPSSGGAARLPPQALLHLGKCRSNQMAVEEAIASAIEQSGSYLNRKKTKKWQPSTDGPTASRFTVTIARGETGLGLVLDEENIVVDMVPGSPVDLQRELETKGDPRLQIGDRIITVDGKPVSVEKPLSSVIEKGVINHVFSVERIIDKKASTSSLSPMSPRGLLKAMTPRSSRAEKGESPAKPPTRALREVRLYKETEEERLGIRFVRDDEGFDRQLWGSESMVTPIVAALDPKGEAARGGIEIDDMVLSINGQTGLSNTEAAAMLRDLSGTIVVVVRKCHWVGVGASKGETQEPPSTPTPETPRSAMRRLI